jgi:hypothetical protein
MLFGLIMYLLGILTVFGAVGFLMLLEATASIDQGRSPPF